MMLHERLVRINEVVEKYFQDYPEVDIVSAKDLMPLFMDAGIYNNNHRNGLPLRNDLRDLYASKKLYKLEHLVVRFKKENRFWYFKRRSI